MNALRTNTRIPLGVGWQNDLCFAPAAGRASCIPLYSTYYACFPGCTQANRVYVARRKSSVLIARTTILYSKKYFMDVSREFDEFQVNTHLCKLRCWYYLYTGYLS